MSDDLVKRLREIPTYADFNAPQIIEHEAADRIEKLELFEKAFEQNQQTWSRNIARIEQLEAALRDATNYSARLTVALAEAHYSDAPAFEPFDNLMGLFTQIDNMTCGLARKDRIEKLEAVLKDDAKWLAAYHQWCKMNGCAPSSSDLIAARKELEEKDD